MSTNIRKLLIQSLLETVGEDPYREGLRNTPARVDKAWNELFSGYNQKPSDVFTTFAMEGGNHPSQMILMKNIEFSSMCEHHMLPFIGVAHIAYVPNKMILGASKMARLLEIYSRRLQLQERIGEQVSSDLMNYLKPEGAACILVAKHLCISSRGVMKQKSEFITANLKGCFLDEASTRAELYSMINL